MKTLERMNRKRRGDGGDGGWSRSGSKPVNGGGRGVGIALKGTTDQLF